MRRVSSPQAAAFLALAALLLVGCSDDPTVEAGQPHEGGGLVPGEGEAEVVKDVSYPAGPYGHDVGTTIQNFKFVGMLRPMEAGYVADENTLGNLSFANYYNPEDDPERPVAMVLNASALWCTVCQEEARQSVANYAYWRERRVEFVTSIFEDNNGEPSMLEDIEYWAERFKLEYPVVLDPDLTLGVFFDKSASPFNMIIDLRTMTIVEAEEGLTDLGASNPTLVGLTGITE